METPTNQNFEKEYTQELDFRLGELEDEGIGKNAGLVILGEKDIEDFKPGELSPEDLYFILKLHSIDNGIDNKVLEYISESEDLDFIYECAIIIPPYTVLQELWNIYCTKLVNNAYNIKDAKAIYRHYYSIIDTCKEIGDKERAIIDELERRRFSDEIQQQLRGSSKNFQKMPEYVNPRGIDLKGDRWHFVYNNIVLAGKEALRYIGNKASAVKEDTQGGLTKTLTVADINKIIGFAEAGQEMGGDLTRYAIPLSQGDADRAAEAGIGND